MFVPFITAVHVVTVVLWVGGVGFVTLVIFPMLAKMDGSFEQVVFFQRVEHRFAKFAKLYTALAGLSGAYVMYYTGEKAYLFTRQGIGITLMLIAWTVYAFILLFEKDIFKRLFRDPEKTDTKKVFRILTVFHWFVLGLSLLAILAGVWEGHGGYI